MIIVAVKEQAEVPNKKDLLSVPKDDLNLCPETAHEADFLQLMDGWL